MPHQRFPQPDAIPQSLLYLRDAVLCCLTFSSFALGPFAWKEATRREGSQSLIFVVPTICISLSRLSGPVGTKSTDLYNDQQKTVEAGQRKDNNWLGTRVLRSLFFT